MRTPLLACICLFLFSCGNSETGFVFERSTKQERPLTSSSEVAKEELKDSARSFMQGKASEEQVATKFNEFFSIGKNEENAIDDEESFNEYVVNIDQESTMLRDELALIFKDKIELFLNLLNKSLTDKKIGTVKIKLDIGNPDSTKNALSVLYQSLYGRGEDLSLREQYMVFQLTTFLMEKHNSENKDKIVPEDLVYKFVREQVKRGESYPDKTFIKYQIVKNFLGTGELLNAFRTILGKITLTKKSSANELDTFRIIAHFAVESDVVNFISNKDEAKAFFQNLYFSSAALVETPPNRNSEAAAFIRSIDMTFKSNELFLAHIATGVGLNIKEIADIQDSFVNSYYFIFLKSLELNEELYVRFLDKMIFSYSSSQFSVIMSSFAGSKGTEQSKTIFGVNQDHRKTKTTPLSMIQKYNDSLKQFNSPDENINGYMIAYQKSTLGNSVLNFISKFIPSDVTKGEVEQKMYAVYEESKIALKKVLVLRDQNKVEFLQAVIPEDSTDDSVILKAGVFKGNVKTSKKLFLHPLAVIIPEENRLMIEAKMLVGGRIDGSFETPNSLEIKNENDRIAVSLGSIPVQGPRESRMKPGKQLSGSGGKAGRGDGGSGRFETPVPDVFDYYYQRVFDGSAPSKEVSGISGASGKNIEIIVQNNSILGTSVYSSGHRGFKGRKGISSPLCNSVNEYQPFQGVAYERNATGPRPFHVNSGMSGDGGIGGKGGEIIINISSDQDLSYPAISLGAPGGVPGDKAICFPVGVQTDGFIGQTGQSGVNGKVIIQKTLDN
jgi:hypothetical protein